MCTQELRDLRWWSQKICWQLRNIDPRERATQHLQEVMAILQATLDDDPWRTADPTGVSQLVRRNRDDFVDVLDGFQFVRDQLQKLRTADDVRALLQLNISMLNGLTRWDSPSDPSQARQASAKALVYVCEIKREFVLRLPSD